MFRNDLHGRRGRPGGAMTRDGQTVEDARGNGRGERRHPRQHPRGAISSGRRGGGPRGRGMAGWDDHEGDALFDGGPRRGGRHGGHGGPGGRFGPRRGRAMDGAGLQLLLLSLLSVEPRHGYELIRAIEEMSEGHYVPSPGMVYPALAFLEEAGDIEASATGEGGGRKSFLATEAGRQRLAAQAGQLAEVEARLAALAGQAGQDAAVQPIRRAMHNLRAVLMARVSSGEMPTELQHRIVDIIDDAAKQIERIN